MNQGHTYNVGTIHLKILDFQKSSIKAPPNCESYEISLNCGDLFTLNLKSDRIGNLIKILESSLMKDLNGGKEAN